MNEKRITFFGWIDYSVSTLEEIIKDLNDEYLQFTTASLEKLEKLKEEIQINFKSIEEADEIINYLDYCILLFEGFEYDYRRLLCEIPKGLENRHIDIIEHIYKRSRSDEKNQALGFKREHLNKELKDESFRPL